MSSRRVTLAIDAMGGDLAPLSVIGGCALALRDVGDDNSLHFRIHGNETILLPAIKKHPVLFAASDIVHTDSFVTNDDKPSVALRQKKSSSMRRAIDDVVQGKASGVVSAGNTGAYMAMCKVFLRTIQGVDRPAIAATIPTTSGRNAVMLDLGANVSCDVDHLFQFAIMGSTYAKKIFGIDRPSIGLLNVGEEDLKGNIHVQEAARRLRDNPFLNFVGFIEGTDIMRGKVDVIITDGFTGNIALKSMEGMVHFLGTTLKGIFSGSLYGKLAYGIASPLFKRFKEKINPKHHNGAIFIGVRGVAVKSHGSADGIAFCNAIHVARNMVYHDLNTHMESTLSEGYSSLNE